MMLHSRAVLTLLVLVINCVVKISTKVALPILEDIPTDTADKSKECIIKINNGDLPEPQPLILNQYTNDFIKPSNQNGHLIIQNGQQIKLFCTRSFTKPFSNTKTLLATCDHENKFIVNEKSYKFKSLNCTKPVYHTARRTNSTCYNNTAEIIEIGFKLDVNNQFIHLMNICYDQILQRTWYAHYRLTPENVGFQKSFPRTNFIQGKFFGRAHINDLFKMKTQRKTIEHILDEKRMNEIFNGTDMNLARGHLAAKVDYIFGSQQRATFYFVNVAPQWHRFNSGNWESIEHATRTMIAARNISADIYTGTYGTLSMQNSLGEWHQIYLHFDKNGNGLLPAPKLFYKLIIDQENDQGIVLIGVNDIHTTMEYIMHNGYIICPDVADQIKWIPWDRKSIKKGYSYACDVNEFLAVIGNLPKSINVTSLLI